eukprot:g3859.t1
MTLNRIPRKKESDSSDESSEDKKKKKAKETEKKKKKKRSSSSSSRSRKKHRSRSGGIQGFATQASYALGEEVIFKVKTSSSRYRFDIYRLGWYQGLGARLVATLRPFVQLPQEQPECYKELPCACDDETLLVDCGTWSRSGAWVIPTDTVPGVFLARLVLEDAPDAWRSDASEIAPSSKRLGGAAWERVRTTFSTSRHPSTASSRPFRRWIREHWDYRRMPPCGETPCAAELHAYGAQRHRQKTMLRNALREPHASHIYFVIRQDARKTEPG